MLARINSRARVVAPVCIAAGALLLTGCSSTLTVTTATTDPTPVVSIAATPQGGTEIDPDTQIVVEAELGRLTQVLVVGPDGDVPGILAEDGSRWTATGASLDYSATYTITAQAADARGRVNAMDSSFSTLEPEKFFRAEVSPHAGEVVGVGEPIVVSFNKKVENKAEVEAALRVRTGKPVLELGRGETIEPLSFAPRSCGPETWMSKSISISPGCKPSPVFFGKSKLQRMPSHSANQW